MPSWWSEGIAIEDAGGRDEVEAGPVDGRFRAVESR